MKSMPEFSKIYGKSIENGVRDRADTTDRADATDRADVIFYLSDWNESCRHQWKACPNYSKFYVKSVENGVQNLSKMGSRRVLGGSLERLGAILRGHVASRSIFHWFWGPFWDPFGAMLGSKIVKKSIFGDSKRPPKLNTPLHGFQHRFLIDFGPILDLFLIAFCIDFWGRSHAHDINATPVIFQIIFNDFRISSLQ